MHRQTRLGLSLTCALTCASPVLGLQNAAGAAAPALRLPALIGDGMVLQRDASATLWGWAAAGEAVILRPSWLEEPLEALTDRNGRWSIAVPTPPAGGPHTIVIEASEKVVLEDVWSGEVWIASGQSNMQWPLSETDHAEEDVAAAHHPRLRLFEVARAVALAPAEDCEGSWRACTPESAREFSAVGYHFGRELLEELDVPVGVIGTYWGGTPAEAWTSVKTMSLRPEFAGVLEQLEIARREGDSGDTLADLRSAWWSSFEERSMGFRGGWMNAIEDGRGWSEVQVPHEWNTPDLESFDGCVWYRRTVDVPAAWAGRELALELGPIDDMDLVFANGALVGATRVEGAWQTPRRYAIPAASVTAGALMITVCALDTGGGGRFGASTVPMRLTPAGAEETPSVSLAGAWFARRGSALSEFDPWPRSGRFNQNQPTTLFNGMLAPLLPLTFRGAIWYQGESNVARAVQYRTLFPDMIRDWRAAFDQGDFPFYFVQIAPFGYRGDQGQAAELREAQAGALGLPNTGMVVTLDVGDERDIHPRDKRTVGHRLALWALARTYGREGVVCSGPRYVSHEIEGSTIRVRFEHTDGGLQSSRGPLLSHFRIAGADREFHLADADIDGATIVVSSPAVPEPVAVRFAWGAADAPNLCNGAGLPASSFRTDTWPAVSRSQ